MRKSKLMRGLLATSGALFGALMVGTQIASTYNSWINTQLSVTNWQVVTPAGEDPKNYIYWKSDYSKLEDLTSAKVDLATEIASEGVTLLKNNLINASAALPLAKSETITLWGLNSHYPTQGGMIGSQATVAPDGSQTNWTLELALKDVGGFTLNQDMIDFYASFTDSDKADTLGQYLRRGFGQTGHGLSPAFGTIYSNTASTPSGEAPMSVYPSEVLSSADNTTAVVVISRDSSEAADYYPEQTCSTPGDSFTSGPLSLSTYEKAVIEAAKQHSNGKVVVLINASNPMEIEELVNDDGIDAIMWVGTPGINGFRGLAQVLNGEVSPSGSLVDTYAVQTESSPAMQHFGVITFKGQDENADANKDDWYIIENEGIYKGYKYYETRYNDLVLARNNADSTKGSSTGSAWKYENEVTFPFGYGLSYSTFTQTLGDIAIDAETGLGTAKVTVQNTGSVAGKNTVQLYVQAPYIEEGVEKVGIQLVGFGKTEVLQPGASEEVIVEFDVKNFATYDTGYNNGNGGWRVDAGDYYFAIGNGAHAALNNVLAAQGHTQGLVKVSEDPSQEIVATNAKTYAVSTSAQESLEALLNVNVKNAFVGEEASDVNDFYEEDVVTYTTRSDWSLGWETVTDLEPSESMAAGLENTVHPLTDNNTYEVTWGKDSGVTIASGLELSDDGEYLGVKDLSDPVWQEMVEQISLDDAMTFIENGGSGFEPLPSINLPMLYNQDGPIGIVQDQVANYAARWTEDKSWSPYYTTTSDTCGTWSAAQMPTEPLVAATFNEELVYEEGVMFGNDGIWMNVQSQFAPGLNLHRNPYNARNFEYYSEDAVLTSVLGDAVCEGGKSKGMNMEPKHLAFNSQESNRSGLATFFTEQSARENELRAFQGCMQSNSAMGVMTAFNRAGTVFVGGHAGLQEQILRNEWGYTGWINTDMINGGDYMNWRVVVLGGGGTCLGSTATYQSSNLGSMSQNKREIEGDSTFQHKMQIAIKYFLYNFAQGNVMNGLTPNSYMVYSTTWWQNTLLGVDIGLGVLTAALAVITVLTVVKENKEENTEMEA